MQLKNYLFAELKIMRIIIFLKVLLPTSFYILRKEKRIDTLSVLREICKVVNVIPIFKRYLVSLP